MWIDMEMSGYPQVTVGICFEYGRFTQCGLLLTLLLYGC
jgi:hypothetical protein